MIRPAGYTFAVERSDAGLVLTIRPAGYTFAVERSDAGYALVVLDVHGVARQIASFVNQDAAELFKEALSLAKASAHAAGASGI